MDSERDNPLREKEIAYLIANSPWTRLSTGRRVLAVAGLTLWFWFLFGVVSWGAVSLGLISERVAVLLFSILAVSALAFLVALSRRPERMIRWMVESSMPADDKWETHRWMG